MHSVPLSSVPPQINSRTSNLPTPPVTNETLLRTIEVRQRHRDNISAAAELGVADNTVGRHMRLAAERGLLGTDPVMPGYAIKSVASRRGDAWIKQTKEHGDPFEMPDGHILKGVSALVDADGRTIQAWHKTRLEPSLVDVVEALKGAFDDVEPAPVTPAPVTVNVDLLNLFPCNDWHMNLLTWERETGENWDLRIAERVIGNGIDDAIARSPSAAVGVVLGGGDLVHADNNENRTARSNNVLDADGRHQKALEAVLRLKVRTIDAALRNSDRVIVRILKGNHDEYTAVAVAYYLLAYYRNEPRVTVDVDASLFWWYRFGSVMLGATHGHTVKLQDMPQIMAHRRAEDWGATRFRYVHGFHVHHKSKFVTEGGGCVAESHQAPIPQDAWHHGAGFLSGRSLQTITYHRDYGEISRVRVAMLDAANDNEPRRAVA